MTIHKDETIDLSSSMRRNGAEEKSIAELVQQFSAQTSELVREELALAQIEMKEKGRRAGMGAGLFGGAGALAFYGGGALVATIILALAEVLYPWLAALIVTAVLFVIAGGLALAGKKQVKRVTPLAPERTISTTKESVDTVKGRAKH